jgi:hypothetical protein
MDTKTKKFRWAGFPLAVAAIAGPALAMTASGCTDDLCCSDFKPGSDMTGVDWGLEGQANVDFGVAIQAIGDFSGAATAMVTDLGVACRGIAVDLGADPKSVTATDPSENTTQWCQAAVAAITAIKAEATLTISVQPAKCDIDVNVQASCEGSCQVDASCDPGSVEARCTGGEISGKCSGGCTGKCEGSANVAVECQGTCSGTCSGSCSGTCNGKCNVMGTVTEVNGTCAGQCEGSCSAGCQGECRGSCQLDAGAMVQCSAQCTGSCDVAFEAPKCTAKVDPPSCEASAECKASCDASASAKAECTPPAVKIGFTGATNIEAKIKVLEKWLPEIFLIADARAQLLLESAEAMVTVSGNLDAALEGDGKAIFCIVPAADAIAQAVVNIEASATASISVAGAIGG